MYDVAAAAKAAPAANARAVLWSDRIQNSKCVDLMCFACEQGSRRYLTGCHAPQPERSPPKYTSWLLRSQEPRDSPQGCSASPEEEATRSGLDKIQMASLTAAASKTICEIVSSITRSGLQAEHYMARRKYAMASTMSKCAGHACFSCGKQRSTTSDRRLCKPVADAEL